MNRLACLMLLLAGVAINGVAANSSLSVTIVGKEGDPRIDAAKEAVEFWNQQLEAVDAKIRLGPVNVVDRPVPDETLRSMSQSVVDLHHRVSLPPELTSVDGDIIVALTDADLISFAITWRRDQRGLVAVRRGDISPLSLPNVPRNVIAHELGHVLGLSHESDPAVLMCGRPSPCRPAAFASNTKRFFPLTEREKEFLRNRTW